MAKNKWSRLLLRWTKILATVYIGLLVLVFFTQRSFIYHPRKDRADAMVKFAQTQGFELWTNESGAFIGWKQISPSKQPHERLLIVHGNAGNAMDRFDYGDGLRKILPLDVYILEYPGYGSRNGSPSQKSFFAAADETTGLLKREGGFYIIGESLGTGVACHLAGTYPELVKGMLLIAPYNSLTDVAQSHMPIFPVGLMLRDRFPSSKFLTNYHGPIAMLFAGQDVVVPNRFGHKLYESYEGPKRFWEIAQAGHEDLLEQNETWWRELVLFWRSRAPQSVPVVAAPTLNGN